jgi:hypothetical protein
MWSGRENSGKRVLLLGRWYRVGIIPRSRLMAWAVGELSRAPVGLDGLFGGGYGSPHGMRRLDGSVFAMLSIL